MIATKTTIRKAVTGKAAKLRSTVSGRQATAKAGQPKNRISPQLPAGGSDGGGHVGGNGGSGNGGGRLSGQSSQSQPANVPANQSRPCDASLELLAQRWESLKATAKAAYAEADLVEQELIQSLGVGGSVLLTDGRVLSVNDNFIDRHGQPRNVAYKPCGVRRFEVAVK